MSPSLKLRLWCLCFEINHVEFSFRAWISIKAKNVKIQYIIFAHAQTIFPPVAFYSVADGTLNRKYSTCSEEWFIFIGLFKMHLTNQRWECVVLLITFIQLGESFRGGATLSFEYCLNIIIRELKLELILVIKPVCLFCRCVKRALAVKVFLLQQVK